MYCAEAAVELLIGHRWWLYRDDLVDAFVGRDEGLASGTPVAWVDWPAAVAALDAGRLPCSTSERHVLAVAASIAEGAAVALRDALTGLDEATVVLVARCVAHTGGLRNAGVGR